MQFVSFDRKEIFIRTWEEVAVPRGVVQIVHGMTEHSLRYDAFARWLNARGYVVIADDHRGHGMTDADTLGWCAGDMFADTARDEGEIARAFRRKYAGLPYFLLGFSYGSFLTQRFLAENGALLSGAVIAGSSYKKDFEVYLGSLVARLGIAFRGERAPAKLIEKLSFGAYAKKFADREWLSADARNNAAYHADPLCGFTCSNRFYADFFRGLKGLYTARYRAGLNKDLPVLLLSGEEDPVGDMGRGVRKLYRFYTQKAGMRSVSMRLFSHSRHEFLNEEEDRAEKWGAVADFFEGVIALQAERSSVRASAQPPLSR